MSSLFCGVLTVRFRGRTSFEAKTRKAYSFCMDRDAILNRVKGLRDEIEFLVILAAARTGLYDSLRSTTEPSDKAELTVSGSTVSFSYRSPLSPS